jgi:hypothetical protein
VSELGAFRKYLYWSDKRIKRIADDNNIKLTPPPPINVKLPSLPGIPEISGSFGSTPRSRQSVADMIERKLGQIAIKDFVTPPPAQLAKGVGTMALSEVYFNRPTGAATACTKGFASDGSRVAICLFGSVENFIGLAADDEPRKMGWYSSNAPAVLRFIRSGGVPDGTDTPERRVPTLEWYAREGLKIAFLQGMSSSTDKVIDHPWRRGFSYGHIDEAAEWMAEVFVDVRLKIEESGFNRVVIGAPLWIRTPTPSAIRMYDLQTVALLEDGHRR